MPENAKLTAIYVSPGSKIDAGGFYILSNGKIIKVPPRSRAFVRMEAGISLMIQSEKLTSKKIRKSLLAKGQELFDDTMGRVVR